MRENRHAIIVGATSAIAIAMAQELSKADWRLTLVARNPKRTQAIATHLCCRTIAAVAPAGTPEEVWLACQPCDLLIIACGHLPGPPEESTHKEICETLEANTELPMIWCEAAAKTFEQDSGLNGRTIAVIGSVAGDRGRRSNYIYGAAKSAMATYCEGLAHRLAGKAHVCLIKPGITRTAMTENIPEGILISSPESVAKAALKIIGSKKNTGYAPSWWVIIMAVIKIIPRKIMWKTKL